MEIHDINAGKYICLFFSRDKAWILREIDERRQAQGLSRTEVLEGLLVGHQSHEAEGIGNMR